MATLRRSPSQALFILTSDLDSTAPDTQVSCEVDAWDGMLDAVRAVKPRFWVERQLTPRLVG